MVRLKKITLIVGIILTLLLSTGITLAYLYEEDVKAYVISELNKQLASEIKIKNYNLSFIRKFPYASFEFSEVKANDAPPFAHKETLFEVQSIYLRFNIFDLLQKKYIIKKIEIENGKIHLKIDEKGNDNWHFWKENSDTSSSNFQLHLDDISLSNVSLTVSNEIKKQSIAMQVNHAKITGDFSEKLFDMHTQSSIFLTEWKEKDLIVAENRNLQLNAVTKINLETNEYTFQKGTIEVEKLAFSFSGKIRHENENVKLDISLSGNNHNISDLVSLLPKEEEQKIVEYKFSGSINFTGSIKGIASKNENPAFRFTYNISHAKITEPSSSISVEDINMQGIFNYTYEKGTRFSSITVSELTAVFAGNSIKASFELRDLWNPFLDIEFHGKIPLSELTSLLKLDTLQNPAGNIELNIQLSGLTQSIANISAEEYKKMKTGGNITISDMAFEIENNPRKFSAINGKLVFNNNDVKVNELSGNISGSDFLVSGYFRNLLGFIFTKNEVLELSATLYSENILLDELLQSNENQSEPYHVEISERIKARLNTAVKNISFRKFKASNFTSQVVLQKKILQINSITANTMQGIINGDIEVDATLPDTILISSEATLHEINLRDMFFQFENFTQNSLRSEHINGALNADVRFASVFNAALEIDAAKTYAFSNIQITNGVLSNYEPIMALSRFISVEELKNIHFSTLKTSAEIKDKKIWLPLTEISSSALNLSVSGSHSFDNQIDYRFRILFSDLLWKKAKNAKKENSEFGYEEDDGTGKSILFLKMTGTPEKPVITYDTQGLKQKWKEDAKTEKQTLKQILNKEFGWFKKDTTLIETPATQKKPFVIEWENEEPKDKTNSKTPENSSQQPKEKKGVFNKLTQPNKEEYEKFEE
ncbi:MAG: AsmA family protein [Flavobacteriales bacterium]|nr:AsmA family protein [Flavobacteriales bacterium]